MRSDVVVAGGSVGGISTCLALKKANPRLKITLVEPRAVTTISGASVAIGVNGVRALQSFAPKVAKQLVHLDAGLTQVRCSSVISVFLYLDLV